jgi:hypothetical protein
VGQGHDRTQVTTPLANFDAWIPHVELQDTGDDDVTRLFQVAGRLATGQALPTREISAKDFDRLDWVTEHWGPLAMVLEMRHRDKLAQAIKTRTVSTQHPLYRHIGYTRSGTPRVFLMATGAVGADGYEVDLGRTDNLVRYTMPQYPDAPGEGLKASLALLEVAPPAVMVPLLGAVWRAPLSWAVSCDYSLWLVGETLSRKSSLAALVLNHYGDFPSKLTLPMSWSWTRTALEIATYQLKDALIVIDDYAPDAHSRDIATTARAIIRDLGNQSSRGRATRDITARRQYVPRGLVLATGESFPSGGESLAARVLILRVARDTVNNVALSAAQEERARTQLRHGQSGYVHWLGTQFQPDFVPRMKDALASLTATARAEAGGGPGRMAETIASLQLGWAFGMRYAVEIGALTTQEADRYQREAWQTLLTSGQSHTQFVEERQPHRLYLQRLYAVLQQGDALLLPKGIKREAVEVRGREVVVGWHDEAWLYLIPETAYSVVARVSRDMGEDFPVPLEQMDRIFLEHKLTDPRQTGATGRARVREGQYAQARVVKLKKSAIVDLLGAFTVPGLPEREGMPNDYGGSMGSSHSTADEHEPGDEPPF